MGTVRVGVDGSAAAGRAVTWAVAAARRLGSPLEVMTVYGSPGTLVANQRPIPPEADAEEVVRERVEELVAEHAGPTDDLDLTATVRLGHPVEQLCTAEPVPDLLVVGTRGVGGFAGMLLGSIAHKVVEHAPCPVVVVPDDPAPDEPRGRLVVGVDGSRAAEAALGWAAREAVARGAELEVVVVWDRDREPRVPVAGDAALATSEEAASRLAERVRGRARDVVAGHEVATTSTVERGRPARVLVQRSADADLLVLGATTADQPPHLGSVVHRCLRDSRVPVVVAR